MATRGKAKLPSGQGVARGTSPSGSGHASAIPALDLATISAIADSLPVMVAYCDTDQVYRYCNRPIAEWYERPRREIIGRRLADIMGTAYPARQAAIEASLAGAPQQLTAPFDHPTRGPLTTHAEYIPHRGADGAVIGIVLVIQDVTERRAADVALRESEARFRLIADSTPMPLWVTRADGSRDFVNQAYRQFLGVAPERIGEGDWRFGVHPDDEVQITAAVEQSIRTMAPFVVIGRFRRADGEWRWLRAVSMPRKDTEGQVVGHIGVATDITEARLAEAALQRQVDERTAQLGDSEARFRAIFDSVSTGISLLDADGIVLDTNQPVARWRVGDPLDAIGKSIWDGPTSDAYPDHRERLKQLFLRARGGEKAEAEFSLDGSGRDHSDVHITIQPIVDAAGTTRFLLAEVRDITDLKVAQEQLRQSQKMEALGQLTGGIAHDFNNLLTVVVGGLDLISKKVEDERLLRYARNALAAAERGARLTAQLLAFSRVQRLEVRPVEVTALIAELKPLLRNVLGPRVAEVYDIDDALSPVMVDPTQFEVAILNLAINARDAMPDGGRLAISARPFTVAADPELQPGNYVELAITDSGTGMPPEVIARAMEPFFTTKEVGKGTGLGLSMVYGMARQSGGTARITSEAGHGTTVSLFFRCGEMPSGQDHVPTAAVDRRAVPRAARLLVIDDDDDVRSFIASSLEEFGHHVSTASNGPEGLVLFMRQRPDLVVLDYLMPGMSGAQVAEAILAAIPDQAILFVSGYQETDQISRLAPGATLLAKPFRAAELNDEVRRLLDRAPRVDGVQPRH